MHSSKRIVRVLRVIEVDGRPVRCGVARVACRGKRCNRMIRAGCAGPVGLMTTETGNRQCGVVVVHVALCASNRCMCSGQCKDRCVIKGGRRPGSCRVTKRTIRREACCNVIGTRGASEVLRMAGVTGCRRSFEENGGRYRDGIDDEGCE